ncbi:DUF4142 domain-containing protein [Pseudomonas sp. LA21]|uniref:DUF4142 domain-containing protein n=1 Tax=Pseudomonas sp. LA21 TaxID=2893373 RepID=UPI001FB5ADC2|nr:DUF4142 domain-containing protein [Pseudomonas sp. LA21]MCJ1886992.1 DUF4142 domain-containing protein [Pseudomonas sp. LA21]
MPTLRPNSWFTQLLPFAGALLLAALLPGETRAAEAQDDSASFVNEALSNSQEQIGRARQALRYGHTLAVRDQAQGVLDEHGMLLYDLRALAQKEGLPAKADMTLEQESGQAQRNLSDSARFDHDYAQAQLKACREAVKAFEAMSRSDDDPTLRDFARLWLPRLYHQREIADQLLAAQTP